MNQPLVLPLDFGLADIMFRDILDLESKTEGSFFHCLDHGETQIFLSHDFQSSN